MKKIKLIYNPKSGNESFKSKLDLVISYMQKSDILVIPYRFEDSSKISDAFSDIDDTYYAICISGGDGTINSVINEMLNGNINIPVGIFPYGTANDFANHLRLPREINACCDIIKDGTMKMVDIGKVNGSYFVNVCSTGILSDVSYKTQTYLKNTFGKMAYCIKGLEEIPRFSSSRIKLEYENFVIEDNILLLLILNSCSAGGFSKLAPKAVIDDGYMDVIAVKSRNITKLISLFVKILRGEHIYDKDIYHFQTNKLCVSCEKGCETDIDGEKGPDLPLNIEVKEKFLKVFVSNDYIN